MRESLDDAMRRSRAALSAGHALADAGGEEDISRPPQDAADLWAVAVVTPRAPDFRDTTTTRTVRVTGDRL